MSYLDTATPIDTARTLQEFNFRASDTMWKTYEDLMRYAAVIATDQPTVVVETGTWRGDSARWFARQPGVELVISIDAHPHLRNRFTPDPPVPILWMSGDSADPSAAARVRQILADRADDRVMVVLDAAHTTAHVLGELANLAPLVTPGCHLVVEDTIFAFASPEQWEAYGFGDPRDGNPLDALHQWRREHPDERHSWVWDRDVEAMYDIGHHPYGWLWRAGDGATRRVRAQAGQAVAA